MAEGWEMAPARQPRFEPRAVRPKRLVQLADGVFAIVMTLLVFQLGVSVAAGAIDNTEVARRLLDMWPDFLMYGLSFLVLGVFWLIHHILFDLIERSDTTLIWLNIVFLMFAALIPFSTALFGEHGAKTVTALVYGLNMLVVFGMGWAIFAYSTGARRLVARDLDPGLVRGGNAMGGTYQLIMLPPLAVLFVSPVASFSIYGLIALAWIGFTILGRGEAVAVWPTARPSGAREGASGGEYG